SLGKQLRSRRTPYSSGKLRRSHWVILWQATSAKVDLEPEERFTARAELKASIILRGGRCQQEKCRRAEKSLESLAMRYLVLVGDDRYAIPCPNRSVSGQRPICPSRPNLLE